MNITTVYYRSVVLGMTVFQDALYQAVLAKCTKLAINHFFLVLVQVLYFCWKKPFSPGKNYEHTSIQSVSPRGNIAPPGDFLG